MVENIECVNKRVVKSNGGKGADKYNKKNNPI